MRVFVLCTGRCGSTTFARACHHISNYTAAHESKQAAGLLGDDRIYPDSHIEVDNRLIHYAGALAEKYPDAFYVHLLRDEYQTALSRVRNHTDVVNGKARPVNLTGAWAQYVQFIRPANLQVYLKCARDMVYNINCNIRHFLRDKQHVTIKIDEPWAKDKFIKFWQQIGANGDIDAALVDLETKHHKTVGEHNVSIDEALGKFTTRPSTRSEPSDEGAEGPHG